MFILIIRFLHMRPRECDHPSSSPLPPVSFQDASLGQHFYSLWKSGTSLLSSWSRLLNGHSLRVGAARNRPLWVSPTVSNHSPVSFPRTRAAFLLGIPPELSKSGRQHAINNKRSTLSYSGLKGVSLCRRRLCRRLGLVLWSPSLLAFLGVKRLGPSAVNVENLVTSSWSLTLARTQDTW